MNHKYIQLFIVGISLNENVCDVSLSLILQTALKRADLEPTYN